MRTMKIKWEEELMEQIKDEETCYEKETQTQRGGSRAAWVDKFYPCEVLNITF